MMPEAAQAKLLEKALLLQQSQRIELFHGGENLFNKELVIVERFPSLSLHMVYHGHCQ